jgi:hypothetical protein
MNADFPPDPLPQTGSYGAEVVEGVWQLAQTVPGNDPHVWRKDEFGAWIHRGDYRRRSSEFGWEIAECGYRMRASGVASLRPMQWQNHVDFLVAARHQAVISADGLKNARRLTTPDVRSPGRML